MPVVIEAIEVVRGLALAVVLIPALAALGIAFVVLGHLAGRIVGVAILAVDAAVVAQFIGWFGWGRRRASSSADQLPPPGPGGEGLHPHDRRDT